VQQYRRNKIKQIRSIEVIYMKLNFSIEPMPEKTSKAMGKELHISRKHAHEIATAIKGMKLEIAQEFLENVVTLKQAVPYKRYIKSVPHRRGMCTEDTPRRLQRNSSRL